jgi:hypothetical protein
VQLIGTTQTGQEKPQNIIRIGLVHDPLTSVWLITADPHKGGSISLMPSRMLQHHSEAQQKPGIPSIMRNFIIGNKSRTRYSARFCFYPYFMVFKEFSLKKFSSCPTTKLYSWCLSTK